MTDFAQYYALLGVRPGASPHEIRQAYLDLVKVWHPDRFGSDERLRIKAQEHLKRINAAYEELKAVSPGRKPPRTPPPPPPQKPTPPPRQEPTSSEDAAEPPQASSPPPTSVPNKRRGHGFWEFAYIWGLLLVLISFRYDFSPTKVGPADVLVVIKSAQDLTMYWAFEKCPFGIELGGQCYKKGTTLGILQETEEAICIQAKGGRRECYRRSEILGWGWMERATGHYYYDYSRMVTPVAAFFALLPFPLLLWIGLRQRKRAN